MASSALTEKINKIRQLNEEIKRRHEEVEEDKKNAAKQNALVQMVPSTDWPERKEPPEFTNPSKTKQKSTKEKHDYVPQSHSGEGRKIHSFAQGEGPPPDPKYNFLADSEREEPTEHAKETVGNRFNNKTSRGSFRKKIGGRENLEKDNKMNKGNYRDESQSGYDAWRAERNRIDEDRISRQRTAEGNWLREWDNDKFIAHSRNDEFERDANRDHAPAQYYPERLENSAFPRFSRARRKYKDSGRRYDNNNEHGNYNQGGNYRPYRGSARNLHGNHDNRSHAAYSQPKNSAPVAKSSESSTSEERTVVATEKSIKVTVNQSGLTKGPVTSVKVNSPSIAGTGRVGPRQRTRVTYSHSDVDSPSAENESFFRQKSFEDKSKGSFFGNQKFPNVKRSHSQRKKDSDSRGPHYQRKENDTGTQSYSQNDQQKPYAAKSPKSMRGSTRTTKHDSWNVFQQCSTANESNVEHNVTTEYSESEETVNSEMNIENEATNEEGILMKETEEALSGSLSGTESPEHVDKDSTKKIDPDNDNKGLEEVANNSTEDVEANNTRSKDVLELNKNNEESNDLVEPEKILSSKDDQQPIEQVIEQSESSNSKDIENQVIVQQTVDNSESPLESKTPSVIEMNDQAQEENRNENDGSSDQISKDIVSSEMDSKDTVSNTKTSSIEEIKEKNEEIINEKVNSTEEL